MLPELKRIFRYCLVYLILCSNIIESSESLPETDRIERAILGGFSSQDIVGGGEPGKDFPTFSSVPRSPHFSCEGRHPGYYADEEYGCQVFHICHSDRRKDSFLCPNGTIFHQLRLVCDWWYNVDCSSSALHVNVNADIGKISRDGGASVSSPPRTSFTSGEVFSKKKTISTFRSTPNAVQTPINQQQQQQQQPRVSPPRTHSGSSRPSLQDVVVNNQHVTQSAIQSFSQGRINDNAGAGSGVPLPISQRESFNSPATTPAPRTFPDHFKILKPGISLPQPNRFDNSIDPGALFVKSGVDSSTTGQTSGIGIPLPSSKRPSIGQTNVRSRTDEVPRAQISNIGISLPSPKITGTDQTGIQSQVGDISRSQILNVGIPLPSSKIPGQGQTSVRSQLGDISRSQITNAGIPLPFSKIPGPGQTSVRSQGGDISRSQITNVGIPLPSPKKHLTGQTSVGSRGDDASRAEVSSFGIPLPPSRRTNTVSNNLRSRTDGSSRAQISNVGIPLPPPSKSPDTIPNNVRSRLDSISNVQTSKFGVPLPPSNRIDNHHNAGLNIIRSKVDSGSGADISHLKRVKINKRPLGLPISPSINQVSNNFGSTPAKTRAPAIPSAIQTSSRTTRPRQQQQQQQLSNVHIIVDDSDEVTFIGDGEVTHQIFNDGHQEVSSNFGRPLPTRGRGNKKFGVPLPAVSNNNLGSSIHKDNSNNFGAPRQPVKQISTNVGVPLPRVNNANNFGVPLLKVKEAPNSNFGIPLPPVNNQIVRPHSAQQQNRVQNTPTTSTNRGTATFSSSRFGIRNNQATNVNRRPVEISNQQFAVIKANDDDLFDDLDDLNDPFDDDRFDLDDKFDDDRFDIDDKIDDDRFDNDPFDDDRFDDDDDDDLDDRLDRFDNGNDFKFDRRTRGSTFPSNLGETKTKIIDSKTIIEPPSEIQLPPPPL